MRAGRAGAGDRCYERSSSNISQDHVGLGLGDDEDSTYDDEPGSSGSVPSRYQAARADASIDTIRRTIEAVFGLPAASVALRGPDKKNLRRCHCGHASQALGVSE